MALRRLTLPVGVLLFLGFLTGCETTETKKPATVPAQTTAPEVTAPAASKTTTPQQDKSQEPAQPKQSNGQSGAVDTLIAQAEKQYAAGQSNYKAGHLE